MHNVELPRWAEDLALKRHGRLHVYDRLQPSSTALIVIDMQNAFVDGASEAAAPFAPSIVPNINRLASVVRKRGGRVFFTRHKAEADSAWNRYIELIMLQNEQHALAMLGEGAYGYAIHASLDVLSEDIVVDKTRFSAFSVEHCDLHVQLQQAGIDTILIAGALTNVCCESTARDAMALDYRAIMISDATAARSDEAHNAALTNIYTVFGDVATTDVVIERLQSA